MSCRCVRRLCARPTWKPTGRTHRWIARTSGTCGRHSQAPVDNRTWRYGRRAWQSESSRKIT
eukprot:12559396-Prorocentrum_lima.AAC.1